MTAGVGRYKGEQGEFQIGDLIHTMQPAVDKFCTADPIVEASGWMNSRGGHNGRFSRENFCVYPSVYASLCIVNIQVEHSYRMWCLTYLVVGLVEGFTLPKSDLDRLHLYATTKPTTHNVFGWTSGMGYRKIASQPKERIDLNPFARKTCHYNRLLVAINTP